MLWENKTSFSLIFCLSFSLLCIFWQRNPFAQNIGLIGRLADQFSGFINSTLSYTDVLWVEIDKYQTLEERYNKAKKTLEKYRLEKEKFDNLQNQNNYLREALRMRNLTDYPEVRAEVLGVRLNSISPRIIIAKGQSSGIQSLMPVIARSYNENNSLVRSVVGLTVVADNNTSVVQPITHPSFQIGVRIDTSGEWAILSGNSGRINETLLSYITTDFSPDRAILSQTESDFFKNTQVNTSGAGGIFPSGIPVGTISGLGRRKNDFKTAYVKPYVDISRLDYVSVIIKETEAWSQAWEQELRWEEHLKTEFGEISYPKLEKTKKTRKKTVRKKQTKKKVVPTKSNVEKKDVREKPRRLQNLESN